MCGRARLSSDVSEIKLVFSIPLERPTPNIPANWNAAPTEDDVRRAVAGNLCRCGAYPNIVKAGVSAGKRKS